MRTIARAILEIKKYADVGTILEVNQYSLMIDEIHGERNIIKITGLSACGMTFIKRGNIGGEITRE